MIVILRTGYLRGTFLPLQLLESRCILPASSVVRDDRVFQRSLPIGTEQFPEYFVFVGSRMAFAMAVVDLHLHRLQWRAINQHEWTISCALSAFFTRAIVTRCIRVISVSSTCQIGVLAFSYPTTERYQRARSFCSDPLQMDL